MIDDVVVVGGGLAGSIAALAAARTRPSASVGLVSGAVPTPGTGSDPASGAETAPDTAGGPELRAGLTPGGASGLVGVLGYRPDGDGPVVDPFEAIPGLPPSHPYTVVGVEGVREGLALFDDVVGEAYGGDGTDRNALVPTAWGRLTPTARYPASVGPGLASNRLATSLVGFTDSTAFDAPLAAERLDDRLPYRVDGLTVTFPTEVSTGPDPGPLDRTPLQCARAFDAAEQSDTAEHPDADENSVVEGLVDELDIYLGMKDRVGFPAVLGLEHGDRVRERLADRLGLRVFEVPTGPPSVPGMRLRARLDGALADAGVRVRSAAVTDVETSGERIEGLHLDAGTVREHAVGHSPDAETVGDGADGGWSDDEEGICRGSQFVLATGGVAGGGLRADRTSVREPVFDCHVDAPADRSAWADVRPFGDHAFPRFGVTVDDSLRPLSGRGERAFSNLRAAGLVIGGHDFAAEQSMGGISLATGYVAGRGAAADCGR